MSKVGNTVTFIGRLTKDPELKQVNDTYVCNFCLARNRDYAREHPEADFVDFVAWGKTAEFVCKYFTKGSRIGATGSIQTRTYKNQNGFNVKVTEVVVDQIEFIDTRSESASSHSDPSNNSNSMEDKMPEHTMSSTEDDDEELPF